MRNITIALVLILSFVTFTAFFPKDYDYKKQWKKVETFQKQNLPQKALKVVNDIYLHAKKENRNEEIIKALIVKASVKSTFEENYFLKSIKDFENEIKTSETPVKQILYSLTAELYYRYYSANRWKILDRKQSDLNTGDIETWDAVKFNKKIKEYYLLSLKPEEELKRIMLKNYSEILENADKESLQYRNTLFDLLADRAIGYFSSSDYGTGNIKSPDNNLKNYLIPYGKFLTLNISDTSQTGIILSLYQHLLKLHFNDKNPAAFVDLDLKRVKFVYSNLKPTDKNTHTYIKVLKTLYKDFNSTEAVALPALEISEQYINLGNKYNPFDSSSFKYRYYKVKALDICENYTKRFPSSKFSNNFKNLINNIKSEDFSLTTEEAVTPGKPVPAKLSFKNVTSLNLKVVKITNPDEFFLNGKTSLSNKLLNNEYLNAPAVLLRKIDLPDTKDFQKHSTEISIDGLHPGIYLIYIYDGNDIKSAKNIRSAVITATNLSFVVNNKASSSYIYILNRETGKHVKGAEVDIYKYIYGRNNSKYKKVASVKTGKKGTVELPKNAYNGNTFVKISKGEDLFYSNAFFTILNNNERSYVKTYLFTDRTIYRPGQIVYFKGIVIRHTGENVSLVKNYNTEIFFKNANYKKISSLNVVTNDYGSFSGSFVIPQNSLNGNMQLQTPNGFVIISVEEYKRPSFKVTFDTIDKPYKAGDEITLTGKAEYFNGSPVSNATVNYRISKSNRLPLFLRYYFPLPDKPDEIVKTGKTVVDNNGNFTITFKADIKDEDNPVLFICNADVTDITGEVQSAETSVSVSNKDIWLKIEAPSKINLNDKFKIKVLAVNSTGKKVDTKAELKIYRLQQPGKVFKKRYWSKPDIYIIDKKDFEQLFPMLPYKNEDLKSTWPANEIFKENIYIKGEKALDKNLLTNLTPGYYKIVLSKGDENKISSIVAIFNSTVKRPAFNEIFWYNISRDKAEPSETVNITVASAVKNSFVHYSLTRKNEVLDSGVLKLSKKQITIPVKIKENMRGGIAINLNLVKYNRFFNVNKSINIPYTNKKLKIKLETERNHLIPGQKEKWKVTITDYQNNPVTAEVLASMYDASLDEIKPYKWNFNLYRQHYNMLTWKGIGFKSTRALYIKNEKPKFFNNYSVKYPSINWFGMPFYYYEPGMSRYSKANKKSFAFNMDSGEQAVTETIPVNNENNEEVQNGKIKAIETVIRSDFRETAFFYPELYTDSTGSISFSFTVPDALTQWKLQFLAITEDLKTAVKEYKFKAYKEVMVLPNVPRILRQGDKIFFTARVVNNSKTKRNISVDIKFRDPITQKTVNPFLSKGTTKKIISLKPGESSKVSWYIQVPENITVLQYHISAGTERFSDAEKRIIPVLTNKAFVTETMPVNIGPKTTKTFTFNNFIKHHSEPGITDFNYTVEFTSNPAWYAIQALPYLNKGNNDKPLDIFNAYFANSVSGWIMNSTPKIKTVFDSWKATTPGALFSSLQKNKELKNIILEETPWVLEAENETEQKRRLALLFDINNLKNNLETSVLKLKNTQLPSGAWPWFNGTGEDRFTTQKIVTGFGKLIDKGIVTNDNNVKSILNRAVYYIDKKITEDYNKLINKKNINLKDKHITATQIQYLYGRTLLKNHYPLKDKNKEAYNYYLKQADKFKFKFNNYLQALIAVILHENGNIKSSTAILESLKERSLKNKNGGIYWRNEPGWQWYKAPVETETAILNAFGRYNFDDKITEGIKIWLLQQKQTQKWPTSSATAEAVYSLLTSSNTDLLSENQNVKIETGNGTLLTDKTVTEAGTGYFKITFKGDKIKSDLGKLKITNPNNHIAWGAAYWQYFTDIDKVTSSKSGLEIEKYLLTEDEDSNKVLLRNAGDNTFKTGDKVYIRLVIRNSRYMEFVSLKDETATGMEPVDKLSGYYYSGGLGYYKNIKDASVNFYFRYLPKGTYVLEYPVFITQRGVFSLGNATIQSMYAPEFEAHSKGEKITVKN